MLHTQGTFVPVLTSEAGLCVTTDNLKEIQISAASYFLEHLLYKPGLDVLRNIKSLADYLACPGLLILNACSLKANKEGVYQLKSPYDGSRIKLTCSELYELAHRLKPNVLLLPPNILRDFPNIWDNWDDSIIPFVDVNELEQHNTTRSFGVYFNPFNASNWGQLDRWSNGPCYVMGQLNPEVVNTLRQKGVAFIETDEPAKAAMEGRVYSRSGDIDLMSMETRMHFEPIDKQCICPTCTQQLTQAYLHHLLQHTPLLCQRFLIQHNLFYVQNNSRDNA